MTVMDIVISIAIVLGVGLLFVALSKMGRRSSTRPTHRNPTSPRTRRGGGSGDRKI